MQKEPFVSALRAAALVAHTTAVRSAGITKSSGKKPAGIVAGASRPSALFGNQAFWNIT